jgi:hypothetical protein
MPRPNPALSAGCFHIERRNGGRQERTVEKDASCCQSSTVQFLPVRSRRVRKLNQIFRFLFGKRLAFFSRFGL